MLVLCTVASPAFAQVAKLSGKVLDATTQQPVPYANVGVAGKAIGTVANALGEFSFAAKPGQIITTDKIIISCIGYETTEITYGTGVKEYLQVSLKPQVVEIKEVKVQGSKLKKKVLGKNDREYFTSTAFFSLYDEVDDKLGRELGNVIKLNGKVCYANDFNFYINHNPFAMVKLRLNIYKVVDGLPAESILKEDIIFELADKQRGWVTLDLRKYDVVLRGLDEVAVTLQWLESKQHDPKDKFLSISGAVSVGPKYVRREKSEAEWSRTNAYLSMYFNGDCYKPEREETVTAQ